MSPRGITVLKWTARVLSLFLAVMVLMIFISPDPYQEDRPLKIYEIIGLSFFPGGVLLGTLLAWRWPRAGSIFAIACIPALYLSQLLFRSGIPITAFYLVPLIPAFLFLILSFVERKPGAGAKA